jgi:hypothetical protein
MTLTLKGRGGNPGAKIKVTHDTKIKKDTDPGQFSDAVVGMHIQGSGRKGEDGVWTANTLNISTPKPSTTKAPAGGAAPPQ